MSSDKEKASLVQDKAISPPAYSGPPPAVVYQQPQYMEVQPTYVGYPPGDQLLMSVFTTFCCFMPLGIIALFKSIEARSAYQMGRHVEAAAAVRSAKAFNRWAIIVNVLILIFVLLLQLTWIIPVAVALANGEKEDNHDYD